MESLFSYFSKLAQFIKHPFVLIGFVIMLVFSIHDKLLEKGIIPILSQEQGGSIVQLMLAYGFWLGVLVVISGVGWQFYKIHKNAEVKKSVHKGKHSADK